MSWLTRNLAKLGVKDFIENTQSDGLSSTYDSVAYRIAEIETHLHHFERWFEKAGTPSGETHIAVRVGNVDGAGAFQVDAGNDDWGSWVQILGSDDTPVISGMIYFDLNEIKPTAAERDEVYFLQIGFGETGAAALSANDVSEEVFKPASNLFDTGSIDIKSRRIAAGTKVWARCMCPGQNTATLDFYFGIHEYEG